jgi:hypothetical protein
MFLGILTTRLSSIIKKDLSKRVINSPTRINVNINIKTFFTTVPVLFKTENK